MSHPQRKSQRIDVTLDARVRDAFADHDCIIRNFCQGGLFLEYPNGKKGNGSWRPRRGERLTIQFAVSEGAAETPFAMESRVAHITPTGFGVSFTEPQLDAWYALMRIRDGHSADEAKDRQAAVEQQPSDFSPTKLLTEVELTLGMELRKHVQNFLRRVQGDLAEQAGKVRTGADQGDFFFAVDTFRVDGADLYDKWIRALQVQLMALDPKKVNGKKTLQKLFGKEQGDEFRLVDKEDFDEWVNIAGISSKMEGKFVQVLYELEQRLSVVAGRSLAKDSNPLGPSVMLDRFFLQIEGYHFGPLPKRVIYNALEKEVLSKLGDFYKAVNDLLKEEGILPNTKLKPGKDAAKDKTPSREGMPSNGAQAGSAEGGGPGRKRGVFGALFNLFRPQKKSSPEEEEAAPARRAAEFGADRVKTALGKLGKEKDRSRPLEQRLEEALAAQPGSGDEKAHLSDEVKSTLGATSKLVDALQRDAALSGTIREAVQQLEAPLVKAALERPELINQPDNPMVEIINDLEKLSIALSSEREDSAEAKRLKAAIENMLTALSDEGAATPEAIAQARQVVAPLVKRYQEMFSANARRVAEIQRGQTRLQTSKRRVREVISERLADRAVPTLLVQLLRLGWDNLLTQIHLRDGEESERWRHCLGVLDNLLAWFDPAAAAPPPKEAAARLLTILERGFAASPANPPKQAQYLELLRRALLQDNELFRKLQQNRVAVSKKPLVAAEAAEERLASPEEKTVFASWEQVIGGIAVGDWLVERVGEKSTRPISLAWVDDAGGQFVFVDGKGAKAMHCDKYTLASHLQSGHLFILEDGGLPLVQRAVQRVLKETYEKLLENAEHDPLTGLINRRAFTKRLSKTLETIQREKGRAVALVVDIDRFKVINDLCGYEGGDQLLINIANILKTYLDKNSVLARIGDDEYGVLVDYCGREDGFQIAETQRRAIENYVFNCGGRRLPVSCSVGMVIINEASPSAAALLKDADSACYLAKNAGRNRTKIYDTSDLDVQRRQGEVKAVTLVEDAIRKGRLQIYVQRVSPVFFEEGSKDEFEVLLRLLDDNDKIVAPDEFLKAAEGYNRMRTLDRWVIEHLFDWIRDHHERLGHVGGISINLSAQSVNDLGILDLIVDRVEHSPFPAAQIAFEINESTLTQHQEGVNKLMNRLKYLGCRFHLDNFGSGVASYTYLKDCPVDRIKIDGSLIRGVIDDPNDYALVKSITEVCHFMKKLVVAEAVEDEATLIQLRKLEVDFVQGFAVGRPLPLARLLDL